MTIRQFDIWLADLNPQFGTEPGKTRPVVIVQSNLLNINHASTLVCPVSTNVINGAEPLRVHLDKQLDRPSDILVDQLRAIDNKRLIKPLGKLNTNQIKKLKTNLLAILDL
jgi:mRNA interferase MazF